MPGLHRSRGKQLRVIYKTAVEPLLKHVKAGVIKTENCVRKEKFEQEMNRRQKEKAWKEKRCERQDRSGGPLAIEEEK